jgi:hypothetical protein
MPKTKKSTGARWMQKTGFKAAVAKERKDLILSELMIAIMAEDHKSVCELADELGLSKP